MPTSASPSARKRFDYASLDAETTQFVQQHTGEIRVLMKRTAQGIVEIGQKLIEVKERLGHGRFYAWLEAEFEWGLTTAWQFMKVAQVFKSSEVEDLNFASSALYELAAPSTPETARKEALARANAGEAITYKAAKAIKQKHALPLIKHKPEPEPVSQSQPPPTPALPLQSGSKLEIVAIHPQGQAPVLEEEAGVIPQSSISPPSQPIHTPEQTGAWWQLGGRHLLYCGDPNSSEFLERITSEVQLLLAFPPTRIWQSKISAEVRIMIADYLSQFRNSDQLDEALESAILLYSRLNTLVVTCFLPSLEILPIINRLERCGLFAEPDSRRCNAVISDWKKAGLKVERLAL